MSVRTCVEVFIVVCTCTDIIEHSFESDLTVRLQVNNDGINAHKRLQQRAQRKVCPLLKTMIRIKVKLLQATYQLICQIKSEPLQVSTNYSRHPHEVLLSAHFPPDEQLSSGQTHVGFLCFSVSKYHAFFLFQRITTAIFFLYIICPGYEFGEWE